MELGAAADEATAGRLGTLGSHPGEPVPGLGPILVDVRGSAQGVRKVGSF